MRFFVNLLYFPSNKLVSEICILKFCCILCLWDIKDLTQKMIPEFVFITMKVKKKSWFSNKILYSVFYWIMECIISFYCHLISLKNMGVQADCFHTTDCSVAIREGLKNGIFQISSDHLIILENFEQFLKKLFFTL